MATYHTVKAGETLSHLGVKYKIDWKRIASANKIVSPYIIRAGQKLYIPTGSVSGGTTSGGSTSSGSTTTVNSRAINQTNSMIDKLIGGVLLYGIFRVLMKVF